MDPDIISFRLIVAIKPQHGFLVNVVGNAGSGNFTRILPPEIGT
jgi:hypothetical protein